MEMVIGRNINSIKNIEKLAEIAGKYDFFIIDVYGVIFDGIDLIDSALLAVRELQNKGENIAFLSNSSTSSEYLKNKLISVDMNLLYDDVWKKMKIFSSGDAFIQYFVKYCFKKHNDPVFVVGGGENLGTIDDIRDELARANLGPLLLTDDPAEAKYMILMASNDARDVDTTNQIVEKLTQAAQHNLICLCPNPDISSPHGGDIKYTAGFYAEKYEKLGQKVLPFGKPYKPIYDFVLGEFDVKDIKEFKKTKKILVIGDTMANDIMGAYNLKAESLLVGNKHVVEMFWRSGGIGDCQPTYIINDRLK
jgi:HAD superfamily hydrolase (TIGR01459 family)